MPELPEIETIARGLRPRLEGATIATVNVRRRDYVRCPPPSASAHLAGKRVRKIRRHGKRLQLDLAPDGEITVHLGMSGRLGLEASSATIAKHTHLRISFRGRNLELRLTDPRRFGHVRVRPHRSSESDLGPDALAIRLPAFRQLLSRPRQIKSLLLDQTFIAGIGNMYADEALYEARIHPLRPANSLTQKEIERLYNAIENVLSSAIGNKGASIENYIRPDGTLGTAHFQFRVAHQRNKTCPVCGGPIERMPVRNRGTYFCPACQT